MKKIFFLAVLLIFTTFEIFAQKTGLHRSSQTDAANNQKSSLQWTKGNEISFDMPKWNYKLYSSTIKKFGFKSIKRLPSNKNVVRLLSESYSYNIIELTWTDSSCSIIFVEAEDDMKASKRSTQKKLQIRTYKKI